MGHGGNTGTNNRGATITANGVVKSISMFDNRDGTTYPPARSYVESDSAFAWDKPTTAKGDYLRIQGLSGGTLTFTMGVDSAGFRARPSGFQIVQVPEPSAALLLGLGGFALVLCRRR